MKRYVIIGHSAAGVAAAEAIRSHNDSDNIVMISRENYLPYRKYLLPAYLGGDIKESEIRYRTELDFERQKIELLLNKEVVELRPKKNAVCVQEKTDDGDYKRTTIEYDCLIITSGASPRKLDMKGVQKHGAFQLSTMDNARAIIELLPIATTVCVAGAGLIGLSVASALSKKTIELKLIVESDHIFSTILDHDAVRILEQKIKEKNIDVMLQSKLTEIIGEGDVKAVRINNQKIVGSSVVIIGKGSQPNSSLCENTEIEKGEGIIVDDHMRTNIPTIFAAGSVCERYNSASNQKVMTWGWDECVEQGRIAGLNSLGQECVYEDVSPVRSFTFFDVPVTYAGTLKGNQEAGYKEFVISDDQKYKKIVVKDNHIAGFVFVNTTENIQVVQEALQAKTDVSGSIEQLLQQSSATDVVRT